MNDQQPESKPVTSDNLKASAELRSTDGLGVVKFDDTYLSGEPVNQIVFGGGRTDAVPLVKWSLPNGDRLTTTMLDYNRNFPFIFKHEAKWRNAMNLRKRQRLGLNEDETKELAAFDALKKDYFDKLKKGERADP